jgi:hypothetical protein
MGASSKASWTSALLAATRVRVERAECITQSEGLDTAGLAQQLAAGATGHAMRRDLGAIRPGGDSLDGQVRMDQAKQVAEQHTVGEADGVEQVPFCLGGDVGFVGLVRGGSSSY